MIGRPPGPADTDVAEHEFTLDNPAHEWFGVGSTARVALTVGGQAQAIGVAEVVAPAPRPAAASGPWSPRWAGRA